MGKLAAAQTSTSEAAACFIHVIRLQSSILFVAARRAW